MYIYKLQFWTVILFCWSYLSANINVFTFNVKSKSPQNIPYTPPPWQQCSGSGSVLVRIELGQWIRNRIWNHDPDPGGQK
jgi:hypothetical protein